MEVDPNPNIKKFVCKVCNKRYPCGKSLGGHLRSHNNNRIQNSVQEDENFQVKTRTIKINSGFEASGQSGYVLRENPKRTKRFVDSNTGSVQENFCRECGKSFLTLKALCGHMACHSEKEKQKLVMDTQSDTETSNLRGKRSVKCKAFDAYSNGSSSISEIGQEQEEVAMCLMMLSRDSGCKKRGFNSIAESSDNNSVILETKSSSMDMRISVKNGLNCGYNVDDFSDNSDSGYFRNGPKKIDSDVSGDGFGRNHDFKKLNMENESEFEDIDAELGKNLSRFKWKKPQLGKKKKKNLVYDQVDTSLIKCNSRKTSKIGSNNPDIAKNGDRRRIHGCFGSRYESGENPVDNKFSKHCSDETPIAQYFSGYAEKRLGFKKKKRHECPICFRTFRSGQALGGHKRSHFLGRSEERTMVINQDLPESPPALLDLNLPAPIDDEEGNEDEDDVFMPW